MEDGRRKGRAGKPFLPAYLEVPFRKELEGWETGGGRGWEKENSLPKFLFSPTWAGRWRLCILWKAGILLLEMEGGVTSIPFVAFTFSYNYSDRREFPMEKEGRKEGKKKKKKGHGILLL